MLLIGAEKSSSERSIVCCVFREEWLFLFRVKVMLQPTISWPVSLIVKPHLGPKTDCRQTVAVLLMWGLVRFSR
jgi:hypothetical protein